MQNTYTVSDYYQILGLSPDASVKEIKIAYRKKARLYHPDINHSPDAMDSFIYVTEAYEFLLSYHKRISSDSVAFDQAVEDWRKYRQHRAQSRARSYAGKPYTKFKNSRIYRSTRILDRTAIVFSFIISLLVLSYTVYGYIYRLKNPVQGLEKPSVFSFLLLLLPGLVFLTVSSIYLKAYIEISKKNRKNQ